MRREYVLQEISNVDLLSDITPQELAKEAKLGWLKKLLIIAIWPLIKPFIAKKIGEKLADALENILEGI